MTTSASIQGTLDDFQLVAAASRQWFFLSTTAITSAYADTGFLVNFPGPLAGVRLNSTAISTTAGSVVTARITQGIGWAIAAIMVGGSVLMSGAAPWTMLVA